MLGNVSVRTGERCIALVLLALAAFVIYEGTQMPLGTWSLPGPGYFPVALGILLAAVALALMFRRVEQRPPVDLVHRKGVITVGALAVAALLFERIGAIPTFALFLAAMFYLIGNARWWQAIAMGVIGSAATWVLFVYLLKLQLPGA